MRRGLATIFIVSLAMIVLLRAPSSAWAQETSLEAAIKQAVEEAVKKVINDAVKKAVDEAVKKAVADAVKGSIGSAAPPPPPTPSSPTPPPTTADPIASAAADAAARRVADEARAAAVDSAAKKRAEAVKGLAVDPNAKVREAALDLSVPKSPAFTALGVTPESVVRPTSPREFAASLLSGADPHGNIQTGIAMEFAPYLYWAGDTITLRTYQTNYGVRLASRTQFSLATAKGLTEDDKATRLALGVALTPVDFGDPRNDTELLRCFSEGFKEVNRAADALAEEIAGLYVARSPDLQAKLNEGVAPLENAARGAAETCRQDGRARNWNASGWSLGVAPTWTSPDGNTTNLKSSGVSWWTSAAYGFENVPGLQDVAQLIAHARYRPNELVAAPEGDNAFIQQDTLTLAGQFRIAGIGFSKSTLIRDFSALAEVAYLEERRRHRRDESLFRYSIGLEYRLAENLYLDVSMGTEDGREKDRDARFGAFGLKWGHSTQPTLNVKP